jgi:hypothetical protein
MVAAMERGTRRGGKAARGIARAIGASIALAAASASGCDTPPIATVDGAAQDAGTRDDASIDREPIEPAEPEPPRVTPCAAGWRERPLYEEGPPVCDPWLAAPVPCGDGELRVPGGTCAPIASCPADGWPAIDGALHVDVRAAPGGDGSRERPLATIAEALAVAPEGATIVLGPGEHEGGVTIARDVTIAGACPSSARVRSTARTFTIDGGSAVLRDLTIVSELDGIVAAPGAELTIERVVAEVAGLALLVEGRATVRAFLDRRRAPAGDTSVSLYALGAGAHLDAERIDVAGPAVALVVIADGASARIADAFVGDEFDSGPGIVVQGGSAQLERIAIERTGTLGAAVFDGGVLHAIDLAIRHTRTGEGGAAFTASSGGRATLSRFFAEVDGVGIFVQERAELDASDVITRGEGAEPSPRGAVLQTTTGGRATLTRALGILTGNGVGASGGSTLIVADLSLEAIGAPREGGEGVALFAMTGGTVELDRADVRDVIGLGAIAMDSGRLAVRDLYSEGVARWATGGIAVVAAALGSVRVERATLLDSEVVSIGGWGETADLEAIDLYAGGAHPATCRDGACSGGIGVGAYGGARVRLDRFVLAELPVCAAQIARGFLSEGVPDRFPGRLELLRGEVRGNPIGVNVQDGEWDREADAPDVAFTENDQNVASEDVAVPEPPTLSF